MFKLLLLTLFNLLGYTVTPEPVRLEKKLTFREKLNFWVYKHQYELLFVITIMMMIMFALVIFMFVSPLESGSYYNHIQEVA